MRTVSRYVWVRTKDIQSSYYWCGNKPLVEKEAGFGSASTNGGVHSSHIRV